MNDFEDDFFIEATELLAETEDALMDIESGKEVDENFNRAYRNFHSLKGTSGMLGYTKLQEYTHILESSFEDYRERKKALAMNIDFFLKGVDVARSILNGEDVDVSGDFVSGLVKESSMVPLFYVSTSSEKFKGLVDNYDVTLLSGLEEYKTNLKNEILIIDEELINEKTQSDLKSLQCKVVVCINDFSDEMNSTNYSKIHKTDCLASVKNTLQILEKQLILEVLFDKTFTLFMYQYVDLEEFLIKKGKSEIVKNIKSQLSQIMVEKKKISGDKL